MNTTKTQRAIAFFRSMERLGIDYSTAQRLRRIEMTLHRWHEAECNGDIQRDEATGKAYRHYGRGTSGPFLTVAAPDKETAALKRLAAIMAELPELWSYVQGDPRGCALYVGRKSELREGEPLGSVYHRGTAVCF